MGQNPPVQRIDHVVHAVADLDEAAAAYEDAGFVVTGRADHPFGTSNRLVLFHGAGPGSYLELVAVTRPDLIPPHTSMGPSFGAAVRDFVAEGPGAAMFVLGSDDPRSDLRRLASAGLDPYPPFSFRRDAPQPDGSAAEVAFDLVLLPPLGPACGVFLCHQRTPERVWNQAYLRHPNGASRIEELVLVGEPGDTYHLEAVTGTDPKPQDGALAFPLDGTTLSLIDGPSYRRRFGVEPPDRPPPVIASVTVAGARPFAATLFGLHIRVVTE